MTRTDPSTNRRLADHLVPGPAGVPDPSMTVAGTHWRVQVLTDRLVRVEWSPTGVFEDGRTQMVVDRAFPPVADVRFERTPATPDAPDGGVVVRTPFMRLAYDGAPFSPQGLDATVIQEQSWGGTWRWGVDDAVEDDPNYRNLGGTARTLDIVDGRTPLEHGVMDGRGITGLVDASPTLGADGWVSARAHGSQDVYVFAGGHEFRRTIADFYRLTGPQPLLPRRALGNWWSRYHAYSAQEYLDLLDSFAAHGVPLSVAVLDMDWHLVDLLPGQGSGWTGFTWNTQLFPDPPAFAAEMHRRGQDLTLNLHPADGVRPFEEAYTRAARRMGIDPDSGLPVPFDPADPDSMTTYLEEVLAPLERDGVDFWWIDWQQGAHTSIAGLDPLWMLNHLHSLDSAHHHGGRGLILSRYAGPGSHRYPVGFSGDAVISWASLAFQPEFTATASNIGYGWWSHDIGGHMHGVRDGELQTRWVQFGVFSPIMRLHSTNNPFTSKEPWRFGSREEAVQEDFLRLRHRLVPYLQTEQVWGHTALQPLIQPMYWEDPASQGAWAVPNEYMFGRSLLVAPVTTPSSRTTDLAAVPVWLPEGRWVDLVSGLGYDGGRRITMHRPLESLPVLARPGTVLPLGGIPSGTDESGAPATGVGIPDALEVVVVAGADGDYTLVEDDGREGGAVATTRLTWDQESGVLTIGAVQGDAGIVPATRDWRLCLLGATQCRADEVLGGGADPRHPQGRWDGGRGALLVDVTAAATSSPVTVRVAGAQQAPAGADAQRRAHDLLERATAAVDLKVELMAAISSGSLARSVSQLAASDAPDDLRSALVEVLTARA